MTRLEALEEEIRKLSPEELAELRRWLDATKPEPPNAAPHRKKYTSLEIHRMLFPDGPPAPKTMDEMREGVDAEIRRKYARR